MKTFIAVAFWLLGLISITACTNSSSISSVANADTIVTIAAFSPPEFQITLACIKNGDDTLRVQEYIDNQLAIDYDFTQQYVTEFRHTPFYNDQISEQFRNKFETYTVHLDYGDSSYEISEYKKHRLHGKFLLVTQGKTTLEGHYSNGKKWGLWKECETIPFHTCETRIYITHRFDVTLTNFYLLILGIILYALGIYLVTVGVNKYKKMALVSWFVMMFFGFMITLISSEQPAAKIFLLYQCFFTLPVYLINHWVKNNPSTLFKIMTSIILLVQCLLIALTILILNTDFSH